MTNNKPIKTPSPSKIREQRDYGRAPEPSKKIPAPAPPKQKK